MHMHANECSQSYAQLQLQAYWLADVMWRANIVYTVDGCLDS